MRIRIWSTRRLRPAGYMTHALGKRLLGQWLAVQGLVTDLKPFTAGMRIELQDAGGKPLPGCSLAECPEMYGDSVEQVVNWKDGSDIGRYAGQPMRLRIELRDADIFSFHFAK